MGVRTKPTWLFFHSLQTNVTVFVARKCFGLFNIAAPDQIEKRGDFQTTRTRIVTKRTAPFAAAAIIMFYATGEGKCEHYLIEIYSKSFRCRCHGQPGRNLWPWNFPARVRCFHWTLVHPNDGWPLLDSGDGRRHSSVFLEKVSFQFVACFLWVSNGKSNAFFFSFLGAQMRCFKWNGNQMDRSASAPTTANL